MWEEDPYFGQNARIWTASAGPYLLSVFEPDRGPVVWTVTEGEAGTGEEIEWPAPSVHEAKCAAVAELRRRWMTVGARLVELECGLGLASQFRDFDGTA